MSGEELRADLAAFAGLLEAEWYNGNLDAKAWERLNADLTGVIAKHEAALAAPSTPEPSGLPRVNPPLGTGSDESVRVYVRAAPSICPMCGGSGEVDRAAPSTEPALDVEALIAELSESPLPGARYAVSVVKAHIARLAESR